MSTGMTARPKRSKKTPAESKEIASAEMTIEEIRELLAIFNQSGVAELEVQRGDNRVRIRRSSGISREIVLPAPPGPPAVPAAAPAHAANQLAANLADALQIPPPPPAAAQPMASARPVVDENTEMVKSPIVGTFYESPSPGSPAFVKIGDQVEVGTVLCIIESMKLMNEIESEITGTVVAQLVENGRPVEYGEALFAIRPR
jgi:acetyl-CoA carboxylase biotin carboxyl carrier protein